MRCMELGLPAYPVAGDLTRVIGLSLVLGHDGYDPAPILGPVIMSEIELA